MKKGLFLLVCFVCTAFFNANSQTNSANGILVYFIDGVQLESTIVKGKTVKMAKITNTSIRNVLATIAVPLAAARLYRVASKSSKQEKTDNNE